MKAPSITVEGKKMVAMSPKTSAWRLMLKIQGSDLDLESEEGFELMLDFVIAAFGNKSVTKKTIEDNVDLEDFFPLFKELSLWLEHRISEKMKKVDEGNV